MRHLAAAAAAALLLAVATGCAGAPEADPAYRADVEAWRAERQARLAAEDGWLTLTNLAWLEPGESTLGTAPDSDVVLPTGPVHAGALVLADGVVTLKAHPRAGLTVAGEPVTERPLASDATGAPDVVRVGRASFHVIDRDGRLGVRVKDPEAPTRTGFAGLDWYPVNERYRVTARLDAFPEPREVEIPTVLGTVSSELAPGVLRFEIDGRQLELTPTVSEPGGRDLFLVFADATSGETTYGAGRFLSAELAEDGTAVLDFNRAYSPPCAFTPWATCPLPPQGNRLPVAVEAGEKSSSTH